MSNQQHCKILHRLGLKLFQNEQDVANSNSFIFKMEVHKVWKLDHELEQIFAML